MRKSKLERKTNTINEFKTRLQSILDELKEFKADIDNEPSRYKNNEDLCEIWYDIQDIVDELLM